MHTSVNDLCNTNTLYAKIIEKKNILPYVYGLIIPNFVIGILKYLNTHLHCIHVEIPQIYETAGILPALPIYAHRCKAIYVYSLLLCLCA